MRAAPWVYRRWESQVDRETYFFYEDDRGDKTYIKGSLFHKQYDIDVLDSLDGGRFFGSDRYSNYGPNPACWACLSFSGSIDMKTSVALVKNSRSLSTGWTSPRLCEFT